MSSRVHLLGYNVDVSSRCGDNNSSTSGLYFATMALTTSRRLSQHRLLLHQPSPIIPSKLYMMGKVLITLMMYYIIAASKANNTITTTGIQMSFRTMDGLQVSGMYICCSSNCMPKGVANGYQCKHGNNSQRHSVPVMVRHHNCHLNLIYITAGVGINILIFIYTTTHTSSSM